MKRSQLAIVIVTMIAAAVATAAQEPRVVDPNIQPPPVNVRAPRPVIPLEVQVTISRYQGEKRISAMPYVLAVNSNSADAQLTMNVDVPVASTTFTPASPDDKPAPAPLVSYNYRGVGTNIVCGATTTTEEGRFELTIGVDESSVVPTSEAQTGTRAGMAAFRNFKSRNRLLLRDGQTRQYTAATDRISGETVKIEVSLKVVK